MKMPEMAAKAAASWPISRKKLFWVSSQFRDTSMTFRNSQGPLLEVAVRVEHRQYSKCTRGHQTTTRHGPCHGQLLRLLPEDPGRA